MEDAARAAVAQLAALPTTDVEPAFTGWAPDGRHAPADVGVSASAPAPDAALPLVPAEAADLAFAPLHEVARMVSARVVSPRELCDVVLARIEQYNHEVGAFITITADAARARAKAAERSLAGGAELGPLHGIPVSVKDVIATAGVATTRGSALHEHDVPDRSAAAWQRLDDAGAVLVGKNNLMEFAYSSSLVNEHFGVTRNPWDLRRTPNGSSSGSGVAVAAGMSYASLGTETGASIQRPASFCGIVGMKPTYGRVSRAGVSPTAWSMDHVGVLTRCVRDAALVIEAMAGPDPRDPTTSPGGAWPHDWLQRPGLSGLRLGIPRRHIEGQVDAEVEAAFWAATEECRAAGATLVDVDPPELAYAGAASVTIRMAEASAAHARMLRQQPEGYSPALRRQLEAGLLLSAQDYLSAQRARRSIDHAVSQTLTDVDLLLSPTTPTAATLLADGMAALRDRPWEIGPQQYNLARVFSLLGMPAVSLTCGYTAGGLPVSLQIGGRRWDEGTVLSAAHDYERRTQWLRRPKACP